MLTASEVGASHTLTPVVLTLVFIRAPTSWDTCRRVAYRRSYLETPRASLTNLILLPSLNSTTGILISRLLLHLQTANRHLSHGSTWDAERAAGTVSGYGTADVDSGWVTASFGTTVSIVGAVEEADTCSCDIEMEYLAGRGDTSTDNSSVVLAAEMS